MLDGTWGLEKVASYDTAQCIRIFGRSWILAAKFLDWVSQIVRVTRFNAANESFNDISICSTSLSGGNQVDGLPPASSSSRRHPKNFSSTGSASHHIL